jgi:hypothetical protein
VPAPKDISDHTADAVAYGTRQTGVDWGASNATQPKGFGAIPSPAQESFGRNLADALKANTVVSATEDALYRIGKRLDALENGARGEVAGYQEQNKRIAALEKREGYNTNKALEWASTQLNAKVNNTEHRRLAMRLDALEKTHQRAIENAQEAHASHRKRLNTLEENIIEQVPPIDASNVSSVPEPTYLDKVNRAAEVKQKAALAVHLIEQDLKDLQRYRNHTPSGQPRYGTLEYEAQQRSQQAQQRTQLDANLDRIAYKPGFVDS